MPNPNVKPYRGTQASPSCGGKRGRWHCMTHPNEDLFTQLQKDLHIIGKKKHELAWICFEHGLEVP